jgi:hypothetical protein
MAVRKPRTTLGKGAEGKIRRSMHKKSPVPSALTRYEGSLARFEGDGELDEAA